MTFDFSPDQRSLREQARKFLAERVLGLPQDVRVDRDLPFDQLPTGAR